MVGVGGGEEGRGGVGRRAGAEGMKKNEMRELSCVLP